MEVVPGYTLISQLGGGMAGDVWQAQAAGGVKVALKVVRSLSDLGGRKELKALKTIRDIHHPNLCPLFGFWTKDADGRVLADGETEELTFDSSSVMPGVGYPAVPGAPPMAAGADSDAVNHGGTMQIGPGGVPDSGPLPVEQPPEKKKTKSTAEQLIVVMGLGDCTLYDRLRYVRKEAGISPDSIDIAYGLKAEETIRYLRASASAIDLLNQEHQIYHCDIKPQNILLVGGEAQVCDFGLAKRIEGDMRQTQQAFATPAYAPPEVLHNEGYSRQVDQYSLAVTYYELRTGLLPFDITTHASMLVAKSTGKLDLNALPQAERKVLQKALRRNPSERYESCTEFINSLAVASGVDKSGGITIGRIVATVAVLLVVVGIGLAGWRAIDPDGFNSVFASGEMRQADQLEMAQELYDEAAGVDFDGAYVTLSQAMDKAATLAENADGQLQVDAVTLFANASMRLLARIHDSLGQIESIGPSDEIQSDLENLESALAHFDPTQQQDEDAIHLGLAGWKSSQSAPNQSLYSEFQLLYHAAVVRANLLTGDTTDQVNLVGLRQGLAKPITKFTSEATIDLTLASLLPVFATTPPDQMRDWGAVQWLEQDRLDDLVRAEESVRQFGSPTVHANRWAEVREAFTVSVEPLISGTAGTGTTSDTTRQRVIDHFPDLKLERKLADLRKAANNQQWNDVQSSLAEIGAAPSLSETQAASVQLISAMAQHRDQDDAVNSVATTILDLSLSPEQLQHLRLAPLVESYLAQLGLRAVDKLRSAEPAFYSQVEPAFRIESDLGLELPREFLAGAAVSLLSQTRLDWTDPQTATELQAWTKRLSSNPDTQSLDAAIRLEFQFGSDQVDRSATSHAIETLQTSQTPLLDRVSPAYKSYLIVCANSLLGGDVSSLSDQLRSVSREAVELLGQDRLRRGADLLVDAAIEASAIEDDDMVAVRYQAGPADTSSRKKALAYLTTGEFLMDHADGGSTAKLACELLIKATSDRNNDLGNIVIPTLISNQLDTLQNSQKWSVQTLRALNAIGLEKLERTNDNRATTEIRSRLLIRPAASLLSFFGTDRFGPRTGSSESKQELVTRVVVPTVVHTIGLRESDDEGDAFTIPSSIVPQSGFEDLARFCRLASFAYSDPLAANAYDQKDDYLGDRIRILISAVAAPGLSDNEKRDLMVQAAASAVATKSVGGEHLISLAKTVESKGAPQAAVLYLQSEAYERDAKNLDDQSEKKQLLVKAHQAAIGAAEATATPTSDASDLLKQLHYESLAKSADLGVQIAFLSSTIDDKLKLLKPALENAGKAIDVYDDSWRDTANFPIVSTFITQGNACEDIAHYCLIGDDNQTTRDRRTYFERGIKSFSTAASRSPDDFKTRYSLARCRYRYALTLEGDPKSTALSQASDALGATPAESSVNNASRYEKSQVAEWLLWKMKVETERKNHNDALDLVPFASQFVRDESMPLDLRNVLSKECGVVYGMNRQWDNAAKELMHLQAQGPTQEVISRMGTVSDIAYRGLSPDKALFTKMLRTLQEIPVSQTLTDDDDSTYQLAKIATRCIRELVVGLSTGRSSRKTEALVEDLTRGVKRFDDQLLHSGNGEYEALAKAYLKGSYAARERDPMQLFEFAGDLSILVEAEGRFPSYIESNCSLIVFHSLAYFGSEVADLDQSAKDEASRRAKMILNNRRKDGIGICLSRFRKIAERERDNRLLGLITGAERMIEQLSR